MDFYQEGNFKERGLLVFRFEGESLAERERRQAELAAICRSSGADPVLVLTQETKKVGATLIGSGKLEELAHLVEANDIDLVVFEEELSGSQRKNIQDKISCKLLDRIDLIFDLFAMRAKTKKAKIDVALAQLQYRLPKLRSYREGLSRTGGGIGTRGPGEQKLETDRRAVEERIKSLEEKQKKIRSREAQAAKRRRTGELPLVSLVGYTNVGKSTLLNGLSRLFSQEKKAVYADDRLFATLSLSLRRIQAGQEPPFLLADTVGFIRDLPERLTSPFFATLEELSYSDLILLVVDASDPAAQTTVDTVLDQIQTYRKDTPLLYVLNKADQGQENVAHGGEEALTISAFREEDLKRLYEKILSLLYGPVQEMEIQLPYQAMDRLALLHQNAQVEAEVAGKEGLRIRLKARKGYLKDRWGRGLSDGSRPARKEEV